MVLAISLAEGDFDTHGSTLELPTSMVVEAQILGIKPELSSRFPLTGSGIDSVALAKKFLGS